MSDDIKKSKSKILLLFHTKNYYYARLLNKKLKSLGINIINKEVSYITHTNMDTTDNVLILLSPLFFESYDNLTTLFRSLNKKQKDLRVFTIMLNGKSIHEKNAIENFKIEDLLELHSDHSDANNDLSNINYKNEQKKYVSYFIEQYKKHLEGLINLPEKERMDQTEKTDLYKDIYINLPDLKKKLLACPMQNFNVLQAKGFIPVLKFFNI